MGNLFVEAYHGLFSLIIRIRINKDSEDHLESSQVLQEWALWGSALHTEDTELVPVLSILQGTRSPTPCQLQGNKDNKANTSGLLHIPDIPWSCRELRALERGKRCKRLGARLGQCPRAPLLLCSMHTEQQRALPSLGHGPPGEKGEGIFPVHSATQHDLEPELPQPLLSCAQGYQPKELPQPSAAPWGSALTPKSRLRRRGACPGCFPCPQLEHRLGAAWRQAPA